MATAINREPILVSTRKKQITFCKRVPNTKLWRRFYLTTSMEYSDAERIVSDLVKFFPEREFKLEVDSMTRR